MNTTLTSTIRNGIDVAALQGTIETVRTNPAAAQTHWAVSSRWAGGTRSDHEVDGCGIGGQEVDRRFTLRVDEPLELCGTNQYANPQEYLLASMNACMIVGYAAVAALMGIKLTKLEIRTSGDIDLRGFLGIDPSVPPGYESLQQTVTIAGDGTDEQFRQLHETVKKSSPNYFNITHAIATHSRLVVE
ncbi:MAG TPA: OsmC family protein [Tepidisphaeraceae bacterium]|nr:OsmC family protein [Tepidisphaeraceae bacterium]